MVSFSLRQRISLPPPTEPRPGVLSFESIRTGTASFKNLVRICKSLVALRSEVIAASICPLSLIAA